MMTRLPRAPTALRRAYLTPLLALVLVACAPPRDDDDDDGDRRTPGVFGESTSIVVVVNPLINDGSSTSVEPGTERRGVLVEIPGTERRAVTDDTGLAVLTDVPTGEVTLQFASGSVSVDVQQEGDLYDVVLAVRPDGVGHVVPPVRYAISENVVVLEPGDDVEAAAAEDGVIVLLRPGDYPGDVEIRSQGTLLFGAWDASDGSRSVVEGNLTALGGNTRLRGMRVEGTLTANGFSAAFNELGAATVTGNAVSLIRNHFESDDVSVPSSSAVLVDNIGIP